MKNSFYETLLVPRDADGDLLAHAYQQSLGALARKVRAARESGGDVARYEAERVRLEEAWSVLSDPARRRRYDRFLELADASPPHEAEELWSLVAASLVDPAAQATLELVRHLTDLPIGDEEGRSAGRSRPRLAPPPVEAPRPEAGRPEFRPPEPEPAVRLEAPAPRPEPAPAPGPRVVVLAPQPPVPAPSAPVPGPVVVELPPAQPAPAPGRPRDLDSAVLATLVFNHGYSGELIQKVRLARGITLEQVAEATRISLKYLEAIEADNYSQLPATTFVRGYLKDVARSLGLDAESLVGGYLARLNRARS